MSADQCDRGRSPSWQSTPCPPWCTREHREDDHPEDRVHQDDGVVVPAVVARIDPADLRKHPAATELVVQRSQSIGGDRQVWVLIGEAETANRLTLTAETVPRLRDSLP